MNIDQDKKIIETIISIFEDIYHKPPIQYIDQATKKFLNKNMFRIKVKNMISCYEQILLLVDPKYIPFSFARSPKQSRSIEEMNSNSKFLDAVQSELTAFLKNDNMPGKKIEKLCKIISNLQSKIENLAFKKGDEGDYIFFVDVLKTEIEDKFSKFRSFLKEEFSEINKSSSNLFLKTFKIEELIRDFFSEVKNSSNQILSKLENDSKILDSVMNFLKGGGVKDPNFSIENCLEQIQDTNMEIKELMINLDPSSIVRLKTLENSEFMNHPQVVKGQYPNDSIRSSSFTSNYSKAGARERRRSKTPRVKSIKMETLQEKISKYITPKNNYAKRNKRTGSFSPGDKFKKLSDNSHSHLNPTIYAKTDNFSNLKKSDLSFDPNKPKKSPLGPSFTRDLNNKPKKNNSFRGFSLSNRNLDKAKILLRNSKMKKRKRIGSSGLPIKKYQKDSNKPPNSMVALVSPRISPALSSENSSFLSFCDIETYMAVQRYTGTTTFVKGKPTHFSTIKSKLSSKYLRKLPRRRLPESILLLISK